jgi:hypothetical protein
MDQNMLTLREQAKTLTAKHGLSEEALLIAEEERKLNLLLMEHERMMPSQDNIQNQHSNNSYIMQPDYLVN